MTSRRRRRRRRRRRVCSGLLPAATGGRGREPSRSLFSAQWDVRGKRGGKKKIKIRKVCARVRCAAARWADGKGLGSGGCEETYQLGPGAIRNGCGARSGWKRQQSAEVRPAVEITGSIGQWVNSLTSLLTRVIIGRGLSRGQGRARARARANQGHPTDRTGLAAWPRAKRKRSGTRSGRSGQACALMTAASNYSVCSVVIPSWRWKCDKDIVR